MPAPRQPDVLSFTPQHTLLNPKFEAYKLASPSPSLPSPDDVVRSFPLSKAFAYPPLPDHARLSYNEVTDRARHNHLSVGSSGEAVWVDGEGEVYAVTLEAENATPTIHHLASLPLPPLPSASAPSSSAAPSVPEYPSALPLAPHLWAVSTGRGTLHLLRVDPSSPSSWRAEVDGAFELRAAEGEGAGLVPFRLHAAQKTSEGEAVVLLSRVVKTTSSSSASAADPASASATPSTAHAQTRLKIPSTTSFEYLQARISLAPSSAADAPQPLVPEWTLRCAELPAFVQYDKESGRYCIGAGATLSVPASSSSSPAAAGADGNDAEMANAPSVGLDGSPSQSQPAATTAGGALPKPPPFSWLQDKESLTVAFPLPSDTPTSSIRVTLSRQFVSLHVAAPSALLSSSSSTAAAEVGALPRLSHKRLWADIDPHTSVWTFDREAEGRNSTFGLLTLHLEKQHAGTRWPDVFASSASTSRARGGGGKIEELDPEAEYEGVPETLDPSELAAISEKMEQWAQSLLSSGGLGPSAGGAAEGLGSGVPTSLMGDEMDVEVDAESGKSVVLSWVEPAGAEGAAVRVTTPHASLPTSLLSTAMPLARRVEGEQDRTISIKHDVDALLFSPPSPSSASPFGWQHTATLPALAFVLATKRDTRFVYHLRSPFSSSSSISTAGAVLAFDAPALLPGPAPSGRGGGGNLFVYVAPPTGSREKNGKSMVVRVGGAGSGALLGAAAVEIEGGEKVVLALCERAVEVLRIFAE
ncbi:hypothetical protein JCM10213_005747 [Rhodosporidiobolus nylandii]